MVKITWFLTMYRNAKEPICDRCKGYGVILVFNEDVKFEVYEPCPDCWDKNKPIDFFGGFKKCRMLKQ